MASPYSTAAKPAAWNYDRKHSIVTFTVVVVAVRFVGWCWERAYNWRWWVENRTCIQLEVKRKFSWKLLMFIRWSYARWSDDRHPVEGRNYSIVTETSDAIDHHMPDSRYRLLNNYHKTISPSKWNMFHRFMVSGLMFSWVLWAVRQLNFCLSGFTSRLIDMNFPWGWMSWLKSSSFTKRYSGDLLVGRGRRWWRCWTP